MTNVGVMTEARQPGGAHPGRMSNRLLPLLLLLLGCGAPHAPLASPGAVGRHVTPARTFRTNLFWIDAPDGVVLIDTGFLGRDALEAVSAAERATGKRVVLAIALHPNPDKVNGAHALAARGVPTITSAQVLAHVPRVHAMRRRAFAGRYPSYPVAPPPLRAFGDATTPLEVAGTTLTLHVLGAGCSDAHVAVEWRGHLFVGDLVANGHHAWLELGHLDAWRARLDELAALRPGAVHPGRGPSGGAELLDGQRAYLDEVQAIAEASPDAASARAAIEARYPGLGHAVFLRIGVPAIVNGGRPRHAEP